MGITLIDKIVPQGGAFRGMVDGDQVITTSTNIAGTIVALTNTSGQLHVLCDATAGAVTVNLPTVVSNTAMYFIKKVDTGTNTITVDGSASQAIDGEATQVINYPYTTLALISNGTSWNII